MTNGHKKYCKKCGCEMSSFAVRCLHCGEVAVFSRNAFISFWLWFCLVINVLCSIGYFLLLFSSIGLWTRTPEPTWLKLVWLAVSVTTVVGYSLLIKWKKTGFYVLTGVAVVNLILNIITTGNIISVIFPAISFVIIYGILQIKKEGVEYWEAMDLKNENL